MIGEVRDRETMQQALLHTLTGHLCLSTLHANNSYHALSRIINMFPYDARSGLLSDLSIGLRAIISQRLVRNKEGDQQPAVEILLNTSLIAELIKNGEITQIKEAMEQSLYPGSQTFEQALCRLYLDGVDRLRGSARRLRLADQPGVARQPEYARPAHGLRRDAARTATRRDSGSLAQARDRSGVPEPRPVTASSRRLVATTMGPNATLELARELIARRSHDARRRRLPGDPQGAAGAAGISLRDAALAMGSPTSGRGAARRGPAVCLAGHTDVVPTGPLDAWQLRPVHAHHSRRRASTDAAPRT